MSCFCAASALAHAAMSCVAARSGVRLPMSLLAAVFSAVFASAPAMMSAVSNSGVASFASASSAARRDFCEAFSLRKTASRCVEDVFTSFAASASQVAMMSFSEGDASRSAATRFSWNAASAAPRSGSGRKVPVM